MNIYIRYFDNEVLVKTLDEVFDFLQSLEDVDLDEFLKREIQQFVDSNALFPKRVKTRGRNYFIIIKTTATTLDEFKANGTAAREAVGDTKQKKQRQSVLEEYRPGWYEGALTFKRVICIPHTQKFRYMDTTFVALVKAISQIDCYNKIVDHLRARPDVDPRCQFPSSKGRNFECVYRGFKLQS